MSTPFSFERYQHSGSLGSAPVLLPLVGLPLTAALAAIYSYLTVYLPIVGIVNVLALFGFVLGVGLPLAHLGRAARCRNPAFLGFFGLAMAAVGLYLSWVFFCHALINKGAGVAVPLSTVASPETLWDLLNDINAKGWYEAFGWTPKGAALWIFWGLEAFIILAGVPMCALSLITRDMFCEPCSVWCQPAEARYLEPTEEILTADADSIEIGQLLGLMPLVEKAYPCVKCEVLECPECRETQGLRFSVLTEKIEDGKPTESSDDIPGVYQPSVER